MKKVAVVEDNPDNRLLIRAILEDEYDLFEFPTGVDALQQIPQDPPDLILMDISLPEMDGSDVLRRLRELPALTEIPVVALTAHAMVGDREKYLAAGFDDYIPKPILEPGDVVTTIERLLTAGRG